MMSEKLRMDGETIDPGKTYTGSRVLELVKVSFNNGIYHSNRTMERDRQAAYDSGYNRGYQAGYCEASRDLDALRSLLRKILMEEAK